jgi:hypothetical protein
LPRRPACKTCNQTHRSFFIFISMEARCRMRAPLPHPSYAQPSVRHRAAPKIHALPHSKTRGRATRQAPRPQMLQLHTRARDSWPNPHGLSPNGGKSANNRTRELRGATRTLHHAARSLSFSPKPPHDTVVIGVAGGALVGALLSEAASCGVKGGNERLASVPPTSSKSSKWGSFQVRRANATRLC